MSDLRLGQTIENLMGCLAGLHPDWPGSAHDGLEKRLQLNRDWCIYNIDDCEDAAVWGIKERLDKLMRLRYASGMRMVTETYPEFAKEE